MTIPEFLKELSGKGIKVWTEDGRLRYRSPKGVLTASQLALLSDRKTEILNFLAQPQSVPLSFGQQRLWFFHQLEPGNFAYNTSFSFHLKGPLNIEALENSLDEMIKRHAVFRTSFPVIQGEPAQVISPESILRLQVMDFQEMPEPERNIHVQRRTDAEAQTPFDLAEGPLIRTALLRLGTGEHLFLLTVHHSIFDGWSLGIFLNELLLFYQAFSTHQPLSLPELPVQYAEFSVWQRQTYQDERLESQLSYWRQQLGGELPVLKLPTDFPRPAVQTFHGATLSLPLPAKLTRALKALSREEGCTLFMLFITVLNVLLYRYTAQEDILIGIPVANRQREEFKQTIGFFINTLVLRTNLSGNPTFRELLRQVRQYALEAYAHQDLPFERLVETLHLPRDLSRSPLFQVMCNFNTLPVLSLEGLEPCSTTLTNNSALFDLNITFREQSEESIVFLGYNTDLFKETTIQRMAGHFYTLLEGITAKPASHISELPLLTDPERRRILVEWNSTDTDYPRDKCIHHLFEEQEERTPDAVAVVFEEQQLTYRELNAKANQLAHFLRKQGVGAEVPVGICMERSPEMLIGLLGILKAGGAYVPLDPTYPRLRLPLMLEDSNAEFLITEEKCLSRLPETFSRMFCLDRDWGTIEQHDTKNSHSGIRPENLAYVIYTSGSSGLPKGVRIEHQSLSNFLEAMRITPGIRAQDRLLAVTTISFDIAALELFLPLLVGAAVVFSTREKTADGRQLRALLSHHDITIMQATPATWRLLFDSGWKGHQGLKMLCGGEALPVTLAQELISCGDSLWNLYGPTETTIWSTIYRVTQHERSDNSNQIEPIGRPINNTQIYILDNFLQPVPVGVPGELYIGGHGVARSYQHRPELDADRFISNPFDVHSETRLYRVGDLARYRPDGIIEFLGRVDRQIKLRGFRIELGEVETMLTRHAFVREAVVTLQEAPHAEQRLVAYVVWEHDKEDELLDGRGDAEKQQAIIFSERHSRSELREYLKRMLPEYMIPSFFVFLDALPLTPNGKLDRHALPAPEMNRHEREEPDLPPGDLLERQLADIWKQILHLQKLGIHDNFFDLGGHSLLAGKLLFEIEKAFDIRLPMITIFQSPTIEALAETLRRQNVATSFYSLIPIQPQGNLPPLFFIYPLGQRALHYNVQSTHSLSLRFGDNQPLYALRYGLATVQDIDDLPELPSKIEVLAQQYLEDIQRLQPDGPYFLCGRSNGGFVAFEMACQLQRQGKQVALLALLDTHQPQVWRQRTSLTTRLADAVFRIFNPYDNPVTRCKTSFYLYRQKEQTILRACFNSLSDSYRRWRKMQMRKRTPYTPSVYPGRMILFESEERSRTRQATRWGWEQSVQGGVEVIKTPGWHGNMMEEEPNATILAEKLRCCLARTRERKEKDISGQTVEWQPLPPMLAEQRTLLATAMTFAPGLVGFGIAQDFWMQDEAVLSLSPPAQMNSLEIRVESHAPARCYPLSLSVDNEEGKTLCTHIITQAGSSEITLELSHILRRPSHGYLKMSCDTTFIPHQENPANPDTRELGLRIPSGRYI